MDKFADEEDLSRPSLTLFDSFPTALYTCRAGELWQHLEGPSLFHLEGERGAPLFITALLHGNEHTGFDAMQRLLTRYRGKPLPRPILLFLGNIAAAKANTRTLSNQLDFNRCWPGTPHTESPEAALMQQVVELVENAQPFASIDIHNNTGKNPHYGCINKLTPPFLSLARAFAPNIVFFERPKGVQSLALAEICPAVTIECGRIGESAITGETADYVDRILKLEALPDSESPPAQEMTLMQTHAIIKLPKGASFSFNGSPADFRLRPDLEELNFKPLPQGTSLGQRDQDSPHHLLIEPALDDLPVSSLIDSQSDEIRLTAPAIPAMLTRDTNAIRSDCLGYLMREINESGEPINDDPHRNQ